MTPNGTTEWHDTANAPAWLSAVMPTTYAGCPNPWQSHPQALWTGMIISVRGIRSPSVWLRTLSILPFSPVGQQVSFPFVHRSVPPSC